MKILGLDTSSEYCSVALWREGEVDAREVHAGQKHSELVLRMVDELLARHGLRALALDGIAFGEGPGSFTGLRIACGVVQGLAFAAGIPVVGVGTLLAMAEAARAERVVCCIDARMHEVYHAAYEKTGGEWRTVHAPGLYAPDATPLPLAGGWFGGGSGFAAYREVLMRHYEGRIEAIDAGLHSRAHEIVRLAVTPFAQGRGVDAALAAPVYIRDKVALKTHER
ncbi:MAG: tRNA (adenosine(37)-N6)-threonylcarbamoyltransferase complex dimerization subunit type 1 TsaB [Betaproteobacteria bacterium]|nr:tRNA (adenosine(37)-N6)-threonylcarbamoyltransferase complex dimerization subunit type 1 TsaB [Betaproteobacteria bacterium]